MQTTDPRGADLLVTTFNAMQSNDLRGFDFLVAAVNSKAYREIKAATAGAPPPQIIAYRGRGHYAQLRAAFDPVPPCERPQTILTYRPHQMDTLLREMAAYHRSVTVATKPTDREGGR